MTKMQIIDVTDINQMILEFARLEPLRKEPEYTFIATPCPTYIGFQFLCIGQGTGLKRSATVYRQDGTQVKCTLQLFFVDKKTQEKSQLMCVFTPKNGEFEPFAMKSQLENCLWWNAKPRTFWEFRPRLEKLYKEAQNYTVDSSCRNPAHQVLVIDECTKRLVLTEDPDYKFYPAFPRYRYDSDDEIEEYNSDETDSISQSTDEDEFLL